jgi:predicted branched-subunit amino acid permease
MDWRSASWRHLAAQASLTALQVGVMGGVVFAGGSQIVAVQRLVAGSGAVVALVAGIALNLRLLLGGGACLLVVWCVATVAGVVFAASIPQPKALGMDFAFTAAFIAITTLLWKGRHQLLPWLTSLLVVVASVGSGKLDPSWALIIGGVAGAGVAGMTRHD